MIGRGSWRAASRCLRASSLRCAACFARRVLHHLVDGALVDAGLFADRVAQALAFRFVELGDQQKPDEQVDDLGLVGLLDRRAHRPGVVFQLIDGAAMGEAVDPAACRPAAA